MAVKVVIADKNVVFIETLKMFLSSSESGFLVAGEATEPTEVFDLVERHKPDLLIIDLPLTRDGSPNVLLQLRDKHPRLKIFVTALESYPGYEEKVLETGADGYCSKYALPHDLMDKIHKTVSSRMPKATP